MEKSEFLKKLYDETIPEIPYLELFRGFKNLEQDLFDFHILQEKNIYDHKIINAFKLIDKIMMKFKKEALKNNNIDNTNYPISIANNILLELQKVKRKEVTVLVLYKILSESKNADLEVELFLDKQDKFFKKQYEISLVEAISKYERLKLVLNQQLIQYLKNNSLYHYIQDIDALKEDISRKYNKPAKYYAYYHWILIKLGLQQNFRRNEDDQLLKSEIKAYSEKIYKNKISSQMFYRAFKAISEEKENALPIIFDKKTKQIILEIAENKPKVASFLEKLS
jgi:hypothetical protein